RSSASVSKDITGSPFFTDAPSGTRKAILNSTSLTGGTPISVARTAASSPSISTPWTRSPRCRVTGLRTSASDPRSVAKAAQARITAAPAPPRRRDTTLRQSGSEGEDTVSLGESRLDHAFHGRTGRHPHAARRGQAPAHHHGLVSFQADR